MEQQVFHLDVAPIPISTSKPSVRVIPASAPIIPRTFPRRHLISHPHRVFAPDRWIISPIGIETLAWYGRILTERVTNDGHGDRPVRVVINISPVQCSAPSASSTASRPSTVGSCVRRRSNITVHINSPDPEIIYIDCPTLDHTINLRNENTSREIARCIECVPDCRYLPCVRNKSEICCSIIL